MFTAELLPIAKIWEKHKCLLIDEWIKMIRYIYKMEYYSAMKNNKMPFATIWIDLEIIMLSEVSQKEKDKYHIISQIGHK